MDGTEFVTSLTEEMQTLFARLGETEALESESGGPIDVVTLLKLALKSELEASELAGLWMPTTPEIDVKLLLAEQCVVADRRVGAHGGVQVQPPRL